MAQNMRTLCNFGRGVLSNALCRNTITKASSRSMFTETALKIDIYQKERHLIRAQYIAVEDTFREKMKNNCESERGKIYMEDLKAMLYIAQEDDIPLLINMLEKYSMYQNHNRFIFGPVIMRAFYFLDNPKIVLEMYNNPALSRILETQTAQTIAMTLLFNHAMYAEVVQLWDKIGSQNIDSPVGIKSTRVLTFAALAKQANQEAYEKAKSIWQKMVENNVFITREMSLYLYLLIQTNHGEEALTVIENARSFPQTLLHMKILALMQLERYDEIPAVVESIAQEIGQRQSFICKDLFRMVAALPDAIEAKPRILSLLNSLPMHKRGLHTLEVFTFLPLRRLDGRRVNATDESRETSYREKMTSKGF